MTDRMSSTRLTLIVLAILIFFSAAPLPAQDTTAAHHGRGRIMILMIWDGLRPDLVTQRDTPNLFRMAREGVRFDRHHSIFPTLTMVNATALATGAPPGINGLEGNVFYLAADSTSPPAPVVADPSQPGTASAGNIQASSTISKEITKESKGQLIS